MGKLIEQDGLLFLDSFAGAIERLGINHSRSGDGDRGRRIGSSSRFGLFLLRPLFYLSPA
jgi:hypothetical protein